MRAVGGSVKPSSLIGPDLVNPAEYETERPRGAKWNALTAFRKFCACLWRCRNQIRRQGNNFLTNFQKFDCLLVKFY